MGIRVFLRWIALTLVIFTSALMLSTCGGGGGGKAPTPTPPGLTVQISANTTSGTAPLTVNFTSSVTGGTSPYSYSWTFGDGATSDRANPSHTFDSAGTFTARLAVTDDKGNSASSNTLTITVEMPVDVQQATTSSDGTASFTSEVLNTSVRAKVENSDGQPLEGISIKIVADSNDAFLFAWDPSGSYLPSIQAVPQRTGSSSKNASVEPVTVAIVLAAVSIAWGIYDYMTDPDHPQILDVGGGKKCFTGDVRDALQVVSLVGGIIGFKFRLAQGGWRLVHIAFAGVTTGDILNHIGGFFDVDREVTICWNENLQHEGKSQYLEIEAGDASAPTDEATSIEYALLATGEIAGHVADVHATNLSEQEIQILIFPGTSFKNENSERQDLTVIRLTSLRLAPDETADESIYGACINLHKDPPDPGDVLTPMLEQREDLTALGLAIGRTNPSDQVAQEAIWVITDNEEPWEGDRDAVVQLFEAAGLDPADYEALRSGSELWSPAEKKVLLMTAPAN